MSRERATRHDVRHYDIIGHISIIRPGVRSVPERVRMAQQIMNTHHNVRTVMVQTGSVQGDYRLRQFEHVSGELSTITTYRESGCTFRVDIARCYFTPKLSHERMRIAKLVQPGEVIVNMFAGVGSFSIVAVKHSQALKIYSIDLNPDACYFMKENIRQNGMFSKVIPLLGDAKEVIDRELVGVADRVLMPLPEKASEYLLCAFAALKANGGVIHYYDFQGTNISEDPLQRAQVKLGSRLKNLNAGFDITYGRVLRSIGPRKYLTVLDVSVSARSDKC